MAQQALLRLEAVVCDAVVGRSLLVERWAGISAAMLLLAPVKVVLDRYAARCVTKIPENQWIDSQLRQRISSLYPSWLSWQKMEAKASKLAPHRPLLQLSYAAENVVAVLAAGEW